MQIVGLIKKPYSFIPQGKTEKIEGYTTICYCFEELKEKDGQQGFLTSSFKCKQKVMSYEELSEIMGIDIKIYYDEYQNVSDIRVID